jgi:hypothetical protein
VLPIKSVMSFATFILDSRITMFSTLCGPERPHHMYKTEMAYDREIVGHWGILPVSLIDCSRPS